MSVAKHVVPIDANKPKTLHLGRKKAEAEKIDNDNSKILQTITKM